MLAILRWKYGAAMQQEAIRAMEENIKMAEQDAPSSASKIEKDLKFYKLQTPKVEKESINDRMSNTKQDEVDRMKAKKLK
jgi:hypothetical protein